MNTDLVIKDLRVNVEDKEILKGLNLTVKPGTIHAIMGPNGSGKSTLAYTLMGHPGYTVTSGEIWYKDQNILELEADERSKLGLFLAFQYPVAIPGVTVANFLRSAINAHRAEEGKDPKATSIPVAQFRKELREKMAALEIDEGFVRRYLNEGFSGGEKKRIEILQMAMLKPSMAIIHYQRLLNYIKPHFVSVLVDGRVVREGGAELALELEEKGYDFIREEV